MQVLRFSFARPRIWPSTNSWAYKERCKWSQMKIRECTFEGRMEWRRRMCKRKAFLMHFHSSSFCNNHQWCVWPRFDRQFLLQFSQGCLLSSWLGHIETMKSQSSSCISCYHNIQSSTFRPSWHCFWWTWFFLQSCEVSYRRKCIQRGFQLQQPFFGLTWIFLRPLQDPVSSCALVTEWQILAMQLLNILAVHCKSLLGVRWGCGLQPGWRSCWRSIPISLLFQLYAPSVHSDVFKPLVFANHHNYYMEKIQTRWWKWQSCLLAARKPPQLKSRNEEDDWRRYLSGWFHGL